MAGLPRECAQPVSWKTVSITLEGFLDPILRSQMYFLRACSLLARVTQLPVKQPLAWCGSLRAAEPSRAEPGVCAQMYFLYVCLLLGALNRLPIKLPRRGAGRRHSTAAAAAAAITFDDVAGVDEAKEELSEIVVRYLLLHKRVLCRLGGSHSR